MAIRIVDIDLSTKYITDSNNSWQPILQAVETSQSIRIEVEVTEGTWASVKELIPSWSFVMSKFNVWDSIKKW